MEDERKRSGMMTRDEWMAWLRESWAEAQARTHTIKTWQERCEEHPDHEGIVTEQMIRNRMQEEIDELRQAIAESMSACPPCNQKCNQGRDCLANKQGHEPSRTQTKQIVDGLQRCHHPDSQHEFLRAWIRDWTIHKTAPREWVGLTKREVELIDEMIETQLLHAERCDHMANSTMAQKQKAWDLERVELLRKLKEKNT